MNIGLQIYVWCSGGSDKHEMPECAQKMRLIPPKQVIPKCMEQTLLHKQLHFGKFQGVHIKNLDPKGGRGSEHNFAIVSEMII